MQTCPWGSRSLCQRLGSVVACGRVGGTECGSVCTGPFEGVCHYFHYICLRSNNREGTQPCSSTENWIKDSLSMAPPIKTRPSFPLLQSAPSGRFYKPVIFLHQRVDRLKTTIIENKAIWPHGPQPCLTQWNYEPCHAGPLKTDGSWWRVLTKCGPLEKGMANHFSTLEYWIFKTWEPRE